MNFELTQEQQMLTESVQQFVKNQSPVARFRDLRGSEQGWDPETWSEMGELGWLGLPFAEAHGGLGGEFIDAMLLVRELSRGLVPEPYLASILLTGMSIAAHGTDDQIRELLEPVIAGQRSLAFAYAEPRSRYEPNIVETRAVERGNGFVLTGTKSWVLNGHAADDLLVSARVSGDFDDPRGISIFWVPGKTSGMTRVPATGMDGHRTATVRLEGVTVPKTRVLGGPEQSGHGLAVIDRALDRAAASACAEGLGITRELLTQTCDYLKTRHQFGVPIGSFQALQHRAADMLIETELLESMTLLAGIHGTSDDDTERRRAVSAAKVQLAQSGGYVSKQAIQLHGGIACTDELDVGLYFKRMRVLNGLFGDEDYHLKRYATVM